MNAIQLSLILFLVLANLLPSTTSSPISSSNGASWQSTAADSRSIQEANFYGDLPPNIFSPTGRLHQVELVVEASKSSTNPRSNLLLAVNCRDGIVMVSNIPTSPYLNVTVAKTNSTAAKSLFLDGKQNSIFHQLSPGLVTATAGNIADGKVHIHKMHRSCQSLMRQAGSLSIKASRLARHLADQLQLLTQSVEKGPILVSFALVAGNGELWRIDPTGQFWKCQAAAVGCHANEAEAFLHQKMMLLLPRDSTKGVSQRMQEMSSEEALELLTDCLESSFVSKPAEAATSKVYWEAMVQYHSNAKEEPRRSFRRGAFVPRGPTVAEEKEPQSS